MCFSSPAYPAFPAFSRYFKEVISAFFILMVCQINPFTPYSTSSFISRSSISPSIFFMKFAPMLSLIVPMTINCYLASDSGFLIVFYLVNDSSKIVWIIWRPLLFLASGCSVLTDRRSLSYLDLKMESGVGFLLPPMSLRGNFSRPHSRSEPSVVEAILLESSFSWLWLCLRNLDCVE